MKKILLFLSLITPLAHCMEECINPVQQNPLLLFPETRDQVHAFTLGTHPKFGENSLVRSLPIELVVMITKIINNSTVNEWFEQNNKEIKDRTNLNEENENNSHSDLLRAVKDGNINRVRVLLYTGTDPNKTLHVRNSLNYYLYDKKKPLSIAAKYGHHAIVRLLLSAGADVNGQGEDGDYALNEAAANGHAKIVKTLLATPDIKNRCVGLYMAASYGHTKVVQEILPEIYLLEDFQINTVVNSARCNGHQSIVNMIEQRRISNHELGSENTTCDWKLNPRGFITKPLIGITAGVVFIAVMLWRHSKGLLQRLSYRQRS